MIVKADKNLKICCNCESWKRRYPYNSSKSCNNELVKKRYKKNARNSCDLFKLKISNCPFCKAELVYFYSRPNISFVNNKVFIDFEEHKDDCVLKIISGNNGFWENENDLIEDWNKINMKENKK